MERKSLSLKRVSQWQSWLLLWRQSQNANLGLSKVKLKYTSDFDAPIPSDTLNQFEDK
jgi:hypothetical protein